jgi:hypothetical protein
MASLIQLHELVHSLDKNEKKYLSLMVDAIGGKARTRYATAIRVLNAQKEFDADKLKKKLSSDVSGMNLSEANNNLYDFICRALINYQPGNSLGHNNQLKLVELFIKKKLLDNAHKLLQELIPEIEDTGSHAQLQRAHELQEHITIQHPKVNADYTFRSDFFEKRFKSIAALQQNIGILHLQYRFHKAAKEIGQPRTKAQLKPFQELWEHPLLKLPVTQIENASVVPYLLMKSSIAAALYKPEAYQTAIDAIRYVQTNFTSSSFKNREANLLNVALTHMITLQKIDYNELQWLKTRLLETKKASVHPAIWQQREAKIIMAELSYFIKAKEYKKGIAYFEQIMRPGKKEEWAGSLINYAVPWIAARIYFLDKNPDKALDCLLLIQEQEKTMRPNVFIDYKFLSLMCHYKMQNHSLVTSTADSLYKRLRKEEKLYAPERAMLRFVKSSGTIPKMKENMKQLYESFTELSKDPFNSPFFLYGDYLEWLKIELNK